MLVRCRVVRVCHKSSLKTCAKPAALSAKQKVSAGCYLLWEVSLYSECSPWILHTDRAHSAHMYGTVLHISSIPIYQIYISAPKNLERRPGKCAYRISIIFFFLVFSISLIRFFGLTDREILPDRSFWWLACSPPPHTRFEFEGKKSPP